MYLGLSCSDVGKPEFANIGSLPYKTLYYWAAMLGHRQVYYIPWSLTDAACILGGLGYNGEIETNGQKEHTWDKIICVKSFHMESANSAIDIMKYWNH